jgi:hypothetical protein
MPTGPIVTFTAGATNVPWKEFSIAIFRNEPAKFSITIADADTDRVYSPGNSNSYFASIASKTYYWTTTAIFPDEELADWTTCPRWLQDDYQFTGDATSNTIEVSGGDYTLDLIRRQDEAMTDVEEEDSHDVLNEILTEYGITGQTLSQPAFDIQQMHRIGNPLDWIRQILEINQAWFRWEGASLKVQQTTFPAAADHTLTDRHDIKLIGYRRSMAEVYNTVTVERTDGVVSQGIVGRVELSGGDSLGIQAEYTFDTPVYVARPVFTVKRGVAETFVYKDSLGNPLDNYAPAAGHMLYSYTEPAHSVVFTITPGPTASAEGPYTPQYTGYWWGITTQPTGESPDDYSVTYSDAADVALHGILRYPRAISNSLISDAATALTYAQRWVAEAVRTYVTARVELLFNPHILPGQCVSITDYWTALDGDLFAVDAVYHNGSADSITTTLELSRPASLE